MRKILIPFGIGLFMLASIAAKTAPGGGGTPGVFPTPTPTPCIDGKTGLPIQCGGVVVTFPTATPTPCIDGKTGLVIICGGVPVVYPTATPTVSTWTK